MRFTIRALALGDPYGCSHRDGPDEQGERFVTVLEVPPVESALTAVRVGIVADGKKNKK